MMIDLPAQPGCLGIAACSVAGTNHARFERLVGSAWTAHLRG